MSTPRKGRDGWYVPRPRYLQEVPTKRADLLREEHGIQYNFQPEVIFDTEEEAVKESTRLLVELKVEAESNITAYSNPSEGVKERNREFYLEEAKRHLEIARAGLNLLGVSELQIEELEGFHRFHRV